MKKLTYILLSLALIVSLSITAFASETVAEQIRELPTVEEFKTLDADAQLDAYNRTQEAYDAYMALTEEEKEAIEGAEEIFDTLFAHFNTLIAPAEKTENSGKVGYNSPAWIIILALIATLVTLLAGKMKRK